MPLQGVLAPNNNLSTSEKLFEGRVSGPATILFHEGALYTGVQGQGLVKIVEDRIEPLVNFGENGFSSDEQVRGRILGFAVDTLVPNSFIIADAYYGIFHFNLQTKAIERLVGPDQPLQGKNVSELEFIFRLEYYTLRSFRVHVHRKCSLH